ncbi:helix-turn-helix domain-containing protein [Sphingobacterium siyangense]|uniref:Helix-turn-helix protein n=1 Tax=Sphingobacterium siyangense TaxID=459529 RepID=A0A562MJB3_9SPHI|nr:helix-turn-helix transcriptional regulator [Sphingobacterium siyangense]TWI19982.1 helix-turn-helix protein [Sphingobacterium siyangense]
MKNIGKAFRLLRIQKGWEQKEFAKKLNLSTPAVSKIETGFTTITLSRLNQIASVFNLTTVQLLAQHVLPQRNKGKVKEQDECAEILKKNTTT